MVHTVLIVMSYCNSSLVFDDVIPCYWYVMMSYCVTRSVRTIFILLLLSTRLK